MVLCRHLAVRQREDARRALDCRAIRFVFKFYFNPRQSPADKNVCPTMRAVFQYTSR
jgi:hypothetical protein